MRDPKFRSRETKRGESPAFWSVEVGDVKLVVVGFFLVLFQLLALSISMLGSRVCFVKGAEVGQFLMGCAEG